MRRFLFLILFLIPGLGSAYSQTCDRNCLGEMLDRYLDAVVAHDPSRAPLFTGFRQTENAVVVRPGTGIWETVTALGDFQRRFFDPVTGHAAYFGLIEEGGDPAISTLRLRVEDGEITEAEWMIARRDDPGLNGPVAAGRGGVWDADNLIANPPPETPLGGRVSLSRRALIAATNSYFDGITSHDGSIIHAFPGCSRIENGMTMTGRGGRGGAASDCTSGLETINISMVAARRYPLVDEEAGVVLALAVFQRNPGTTTRRNVFAEWFFFEGDRIRTIYSAMFYPEAALPVPNWPPFDPNWPLNADTSN
jgi:hypothetical protein